MYEDLALTASVSYIPANKKIKKVRLRRLSQKLLKNASGRSSDTVINYTPIISR